MNNIKFVLYQSLLLIASLHPILYSVGLQNRNFLDAQFTSSSARIDANGFYYPPWSARLFLAAPSTWEMDHWEPDSLDSQPWLQVDLLVLHNIRGIVIRGIPGMSSFVKSFTVGYSSTADGLTNLTFVSCITPNCIGVRVCC